MCSAAKSFLTVLGGVEPLSGAAPAPALLPEWCPAQTASLTKTSYGFLLISEPGNGKSIICFYKEGPCSPPTNAEQWEAFQPVSPDILAAKGHQEGYLQQAAINSFYIGSFFIRLLLARMLCAHALLTDIYRAATPRTLPVGC